MRAKHPWKLYFFPVPIFGSARPDFPSGLKKCYRKKQFLAVIRSRSMNPKRIFRSLQKCTKNERILSVFRSHFGRHFSLFVRAWRFVASCFQNATKNTRCLGGVSSHFLLQKVIFRVDAKSHTKKSGFLWCLALDFGVKNESKIPQFVFPASGWGVSNNNQLSFSELNKGFVN